MAVDIGGIIPKIEPGRAFGGFSSFLTFIIVIMIILILTALFVYLIIRRYKFNKEIVIFERVGGRFEPTRKDKAMFYKLGRAGDLVLYTLKSKKYLPMPELQTGRNIFWFFIRQDGEWINFQPGDFDEQARQMGAHFLDKEMRYARIALERNLKERYEKPNWFLQNLAVVINIVAIVVILVFMWLIVKEIIGSFAQVKEVLATANEIQEANKAVLSALDNVISGSGIR